MTSATVIAPLREAIIEALKAAVTSAGDRVFAPPVPQKDAIGKAIGFPRIVIQGYAEDPSNFYGKSGSWMRCQVQGQARSLSGDGPRERLYQEVFAALDGQALTVEGHTLLEGRLRRTATYEDPKDPGLLYFVGTYEGTTRMA